MKSAQTFFYFIFPLFISVFLFSCHKTDDEKKKEVRENWPDYFFTEVKRAHWGLGTDSTVVQFDNHSNYDVDSIAIEFSNTGLFVDSHDILTATHIHANSHKQILVPVHILGVSKRAKILFIQSKALEFCFAFDTNPPQKEDPFHCK